MKDNGAEGAAVPGLINPTANRTTSFEREIRFSYIHRPSACHINWHAIRQAPLNLRRRGLTCTPQNRTSKCGVLKFVQLVNL